MYFLLFKKAICWLDIKKTQAALFGGETQEVQKPGSRGGKWWIDEHGHVRYGPRPKKVPPKGEIPTKKRQMALPSEMKERMVSLFEAGEFESAIQRKREEIKKEPKAKKKMQAIGEEAMLELMQEKQEQAARKPKISKEQWEKQVKDVFSGPNIDEAMKTLSLIGEIDDPEAKSYSENLEREIKERKEQLLDLTENERVGGRLEDAKEDLQESIDRIVSGAVDFETKYLKAHKYIRKEMQADGTWKYIYEEPEAKVKRIDLDGDFKLTENALILEIKDGRGYVDTPYNAKFVDAVRSIPSRRWDATYKVNRFSSEDLKQVIEAIDNSYNNNKFKEFLSKLKKGEIELYSSKAEVLKKEAEGKKAKIALEKLIQLETWNNDVLQIPKDIARSHPALNDWERGFLKDNLGKSRDRLSGKQLNIVDKLQAKHDKYYDAHIDEKEKLFDLMQEKIKKVEVEKEKETKAKFEVLKSQENEELELPEALRIEDLSTGDLYGYQKKGVNWLLETKRGVLGFDTGLGKTLIAITTTLKAQETPEIIKELEKQGLRSGALMVLPKSLIYGWKDEIDKWDGTKKTVIIAGTPLERAKAYEEAKNADFVLTTYGMVQREPEKLAELKCGLKFFDEATRLKGKGTLTVDNTKKYLNDGNVYLMSATPMPNRPEEIYNIMKLVWPMVLGSMNSFKNNYCITEEITVRMKDKFTGEDRYVKIDKIVGYKNLDNLKEKLRPYIFMKKRTDADVDIQLPEVQHLTPAINMDSEQEKYYRKAQDGLLNSLSKVKDTINITNEERGEILVAMMRMRQVALSPRLVDPTYKKLSPKFEETLNTIEEHFNNYPDKGVVIFSEFNEGIDALKESLLENGFNANEIGIITGAVSAEGRKKVQDGLNSGTLKIALLSTKAAGEGLNLQKNANKVIHLTTPWNPAILQQATDRVHRQGQKEKVMVYRPIMSGTIEEKIEEVIHRKKALSEAVLGVEGDEVSLKGLSFKDFLKIGGISEEELKKRRGE